MHTSVSDGSDSLEELLGKVRALGLDLFAVTDHDAILGGQQMPELLAPGDPAFLCGVEFSCRDEDGKYHILGYGYDPYSEAISAVVEEGHGYRMQKLGERLQFLEESFGVPFSPEDRDWLYSLDNPGKPHIARLLVQYGYAKTINDAIHEYIDLKRFQNKNVRPETAIEGILKSGGIPVLAHPCYGSGDELILGEEMETRLQKLLGFGLQGMECYYSGFTPKLSRQMLSLAGKYDLYVTAGSDYHGTTKMVALGDNGLEDVSEGPAGLHRFLKDVKILNSDAEQPVHRQEGAESEQ